MGNAGEIMENIFLQITPDDINYLGWLKPIIGGGRSRSSFSAASFVNIPEVMLRAREKGSTQIATTSVKLLNMLLGHKAQLDDYAGSILHKYDCEWLILNPLEHLVTTNIGKHLFERYFDKFLNKDKWPKLPEFQWEIFDPAHISKYDCLASTSDFVSFDIETVKKDLAITCCGFTFVSLDTKQVHSVVIPFTDLFNIQYARKLLQMPQPKVTQNGKYDIAYLLRYASPPTNWAFDTQDLFFCWYSEFPKRLDFIASYMLRDWQFWKDEAAAAADMYEYYRYNAKDCYATAVLLLALLEEMPDWAVENFKQRMPVNYAAIVAESYGEKVDVGAMKKQELLLAGTIASSMSSIYAMTNCPWYNPNSPPQTQQLFKLLGSGDIKETGEIPRDKVAFRHPINKRILDRIESVRKDRKLRDTYLVPDKLYRGRCFYVLNPSGTDTGRLASKESHLWCGLQIHNIPRDRPDIQIKECFVADTGFLHGEADGEQAEARTTAYQSGDLKLIETVESSKDYHTLNAVRFFGVPYEEVDKSIRQLSKNVNHGTNYNMGANVLIDTMGIENIIRARKLLGLPSNYTMKQVAQYLLDTYDKAYPTVRSAYYDDVKRVVAATKLLVGPTGWTRYCFADPSKNKQALNQYVAHRGQSLNAMWLNSSYIAVFRDVYLPNIGNFKLGPQIHDSIKFQYRIGFEHLAYAVREIMQKNTIPVKDIYGIERILRIPAALKGESRIWSEMSSMKKQIA